LGDTVLTPYGLDNVVAVNNLAASGASSSSITTIVTGSSDSGGFKPSSTSTNDVYVLSAKGSDVITTGPDGSSDMNGTTVANFWKTDVIDFTDMTFDTVTASNDPTISNYGPAANGVNGVTFTVTDPLVSSINVTLTLLGQFREGGFSLTSDGSGGTDLTYTPASGETASSPLGWLAATHQAQAAA
jgi:hypothetical protein